MDFLSRLVELISLVILVDVILSWVQNPQQTPRRQLMQITEPIYAPIRRVLPPMGGIDFTPLLLILLLRAIVSVLR